MDTIMWVPQSAEGTKWVQLKHCKQHAMFNPSALRRGLPVLKWKNSGVPCTHWCVLARVTYAKEKHLWRHSWHRNWQNGCTSICGVWRWFFFLATLLKKATVERINSILEPNPNLLTPSTWKSPRQAWKDRIRLASSRLQPGNVNVAQWTLHSYAPESSG